MGVRRNHPLRWFQVEDSIKELTAHVEKLHHRIDALEQENETLREENDKLQKQVRQQDEQIVQLTARLKQYENAHTPSSKKRKSTTSRREDDAQTATDADKTGQGESEDEDEDERFPGKPPGSGGGGVHVPEPDTEKHHTLDDDDLTEVDTRVRTIIDLPDPAIVVTKHVIHVYEDSEGNLIEPETDLTAGIYGKRFQAWVTLLRGTCGASHEKISDHVQQLRRDLTFSPSTSLNITDRLASALADERNAILDQIKHHSFVHMDETGLREDGANGWVWTFAGPTHVVYEVDPSRSKAVPERVMDDFDGTGVVDGYPGYSSFRKQRCWDHLIREVEETEIDGAPAVFHGLRRQAKRTKQKPPPERERWIRRARDEHFPALIEAVRAGGFDDVVTKLENALPDMFRAVRNPEIPLTNNHAERLLRKVVIHRKLWGCIRNEKGARFIENVLSCMETWKLQEKDVYEELQQAAG